MTMHHVGQHNSAIFGGVLSVARLIRQKHLVRGSLSVLFLFARISRLNFMTSQASTRVGSTRVGSTRVGSTPIEADPRFYLASSSSLEKLSNTGNSL